MNDRIKQLTKNYLNSLYAYLSENDKKEIIRLNGETNWIIFYRYSLQNEYSTGADLTYNITSEPLQKLFQEQLKIHRAPNWKSIFLNPNDDPNSISIDDVKVKLLNVLRGENLSTWIAVDKTALGNGFGAVTMDIDNTDLTVGTTQIKSSWSPNDLLNDPVIRNSTAPETSNDDAEEQNQGPTQNPPPNNTNQTSNPPPPPSSNNFPPPPRQQPTTTRDLTFLIDHVIPGYNGNPHYIILSAPLVVEGFDISFLTIQSNDPLLQGGNQVIIRDVELGSGRAEVDAHIEEISIKNYFRTIELVSTTPPPGGGSRTPNNPPPLPSFPDVVKKNQDLIDEENSFFKLRDELKDIINKNKSVVQEAQTLGLTLPSFSDNALDFFQTAPFVLFDAGQPLNSPFNQQISDKNDKIRQKALNLKNNIYQIYNNNVKKLNEKKQGEQGGSPPPENELTKLKKQAINKISNILTDPDNLRNIDLNTLAGGKYQNWENDIMGLNTADKVNDYLNAFSTALKEKGVEEKEIKEQEKNDNSSDHDSQKNDNVIDDKTKNFIKILPLPSAKNVAKNKILELFRKHRPDLEKLKENWAGYNSWMECLDNFTSSAEVVAFLERMEQAMDQQQSQKQQSSKNPSARSNSMIFPFLIFFFLTLASFLVIVVLIRMRKNRLQRQKK